jgi:hypothetical protein
VQRGFLSSGPNLQTEARALTFVPGDPYHKMNLFWNIPSKFLDDELHCNNTLVEVEIARQLPFLEIRQSSTEIRNLLGIVMGVTHRAVSLIEKLLNLRERKGSSQEPKKYLSNLANMIMNSECEYDLMLDFCANNGARRKHDEYFDLSNEYIEWEGKR